MRVRSERIQDRGVCVHWWREVWHRRRCLGRVEDRLRVVEVHTRQNGRLRQLFHQKDLSGQQLHGVLDLIQATQFTDGHVEEERNGGERIGGLDDVFGEFA